MNRGAKLIGMAWMGLAVMAVVACTMGLWSAGKVAEAAEPGATAPAATGQDSYRTFGLALGAGLAVGL